MFACFYEGFAFLVSEKLQKENIPHPGLRGDYGNNFPKQSRLLLLAVLVRDSRSQASRLASSMLALVRTSEKRAFREGLFTAKPSWWGWGAME